MRPPRCCDCGDQTDTAAGCPPAEPIRQEEEEGAAFLPFVTYSASYIRFLKLFVTYIKIFFIWFLL